MSDEQASLAYQITDLHSYSSLREALHKTLCGGADKAYRFQHATDRRNVEPKPGQPRLIL